MQHAHGSRIQSAALRRSPRPTAYVFDGLIAVTAATSRCPSPPRLMGAAVVEAQTAGKPKFFLSCAVPYAVPSSVTAFALPPGAPPVASNDNVQLPSERLRAHMSAPASCPTANWPLAEMAIGAALPLLGSTVAENPETPGVQTVITLSHQPITVPLAATSCAREYIFPAGHGSTCTVQAPAAVLRHSTAV